MKDSNNIEEIFRNKLYNMEMKPSAAGWSALEHAMELRKRKRSLSRYYLASGVAAALMAAALIIGSLTNNDVAVEQLITENKQKQTETQIIKSEVATETESVAMADNTSGTAKVVKVVKVAKSNVTKSNAAKSGKMLMAAKVRSHDDIGEVKIENADDADDVENAEPVEPLEPVEISEKTPTETTKETKSVSGSASKNSRQRELFAQELARQNRLDKQKSSRWSADIATSGAMLASNNITNGTSSVTPRYALTEVSALSSTKGDISSAKMKHKLPISVGLTAKYKILPRLAVETGIMYSYLESDSELKAAADYHRVQHLHYIGVPINLSYRFAQISKVEFYTSVGGMAEWLVDGDMVTTISKDNHQISKKREDIAENSPLWSANISVGVGYNFIKHLGVFIEPGVSYYFTNNSQPTSYKTEKPLSFNLRLGVRANF